MRVCVRSRPHLLLLRVELEALGEGAGLRLVMLLPVQIDALGVRNVLLLGVAEQTEEEGGDTESIHSAAWGGHVIVMRLFYLENVDQTVSPVKCDMSGQMFHTS